MSELEREEVMEEQEERAPFIVDDDEKAEWCLTQIRQKKTEIEKWVEHYDKLKSKIVDKLTSDINWFEASLRSYMMQVHEEGGTRITKTQEAYDLPSGKIVMKKQAPEYTRDDAAILEWLEENNPDLIKITKTVDWAGLKKTLTAFGENVVDENGEVVPGITITERPDVFKVEVK